MPQADDDTPLLKLRLDYISTKMAHLEDMSKFVFRYGAAVQRYLKAILRDVDKADDVWQELLTNLLKRGGPTTWPGQGRFRDYLRTMTRNAALMHLRKQQRQHTSQLPEEIAVPAERELDEHWQRCLLDKVWRDLEQLERKNQGNFAFTALKVYIEHAEADSKAQAEMVSQRLGRVVSPENFRQQVSRGKRQMAEYILMEVAATIANSKADDVEIELKELGLMQFVEDYLPRGWQTTFFAE